MPRTSPPKSSRRSIRILQGGDLFVSRSLEEADEIARVLVSRGYGTVLTGGGDGTSA
jgi:diacylglycerol kinase family enzyme